MAIQDEFKQAVLRSTFLTSYQRDAFLDGVDDMPEEYLANVLSILKEFTIRSKKREESVRQKIGSALARYEETIRDISDLDDEAKGKLMTQARVLSSAITRNQ